jgi:uncharacterized protein (TIGR00725 family)
MRARERRPIVGVMGSGSQPHEESAGALGRWLAREGVHLLTGGGGGVMASVSRAFFEVSDRKGLVIGVLPGLTDTPACHPPAGYPNPWAEIPIYTHLPLRGDRGGDPRSRNSINVLSSDVLVALPGGPGTASEVRLALRYGRPLVAYLESRSEIEDLPGEIAVRSSLSEVQEFVRGQLARMD